MNDWSQDPKLAKVPPGMPELPAISREAADAQTEAVKKIMTEQGLDFGPAYDVYIREQQRTPVDESGWDAA